MCAKTRCVLIAALVAKTADLRMAGLRGLARPGQVLPPTALDLRTDTDAGCVRRCSTRWVWCNRPTRLDYLDRGLDDLEFSVRLAAVRNFGALVAVDSPLRQPARERLSRVMQLDAEMLRAEAVGAWARAGDECAVVAAGSDKSWRVRLAAAKELANFPTRSAAGLASDLLKDQSPTVELAMVASLANWPLDRGAPCSCKHVDNWRIARARMPCRLAQRWPAASGFSADAPPEAAVATLADLGDRWREQFGNIDRQARRRPRRPCRTAPTMPAERIARLEQLLRQASAENSPDCAAASEELRKFGPDLEDGLEIVALTRNERLPEFVFRDILPSQSQVFTEMYRMSSGDITDRRRASGQLAVLAGATPLRPWHACGWPNRGRPKPTR